MERIAHTTYAASAQRAAPVALEALPASVSAAVPGSHTACLHATYASTVQVVRNVTSMYTRASWA